MNPTDFIRTEEFVDLSWSRAPVEVARRVLQHFRQYYQQQDYQATLLARMKDGQWVEASVPLVFPATTDADLQEWRIRFRRHGDIGRWDSRIYRRNACEIEYVEVPPEGRTVVNSPKQN